MPRQAPKNLPLNQRPLWPRRREPSSHFDWIIRNNMELNESNIGAVGVDKLEPGVLPYSIRLQILNDAERYFPSALCPAHSQTQSAFVSAKSDYIKDRIRRWQKN